MSAFCPHGQTDRGGQPNLDWSGHGGGASQKFPNLCGHLLWMIPKVGKTFIPLFLSFEMNLMPILFYYIFQVVAQ